MSAYLDLPLRSLRDLHAETEAKVLALEVEQCALMDLATEADLTLRFHAAEQLKLECDAISDELGPLLDRLDVLEQEIAFRNQPRFTGGDMP